jgi:very-short-patch-repair endonuclease
MSKKMKTRVLSIILAVLVVVVLPSCGLLGKKGSASEKDNRRGEVTGVPKRVIWQQILPQEMVPVKAGTFWMGQADEDIAFSQSSLNKQITISEFYMDKYEVSNNKYRQFIEAVRLGEYTYSTPTTLKDAPTFDINTVLPDTTVWNTSFTYHYGDPLMEFYFDHPAFDNYPVVGVNWHQATEFARWRTDRVNEYILDRQRIIGNYIVDFYVKALGLIVEIDGISHENKIEYDATRQTFLENLGLHVFRATDAEVKLSILDVMERLEHFIIEVYGIKDEV